MPDRPVACKCQIVTTGGGADPSCAIHGTTIRTEPDFIIDGKPYEGELLFPELKGLDDA